LQVAVFAHAVFVLRLSLDLLHQTPRESHYSRSPSQPSHSHRSHPEYTEGACWDARPQRSGREHIPALEHHRPCIRHHPQRSGCHCHLQPYLRQILRLAAAAAVGDYPAGMDRATAQATLKAASNPHHRDSSLAIQVCQSIENVSSRLPAAVQGAGAAVPRLTHQTARHPHRSG